MGRTFIISDELETKPWKLTSKTTKILDYTCMGAELELGGKSILATAFLATSVELTPPAKEAVADLSDGKRVTQTQFDKIVDEKTKEYKETEYDGNYHK